ncbi:SUN domain-containing protein 1 isoform X5 [Brachyhypopomus gauderio]|uniref:SUN domain-containing protein 1 isoform X5 n=1 Tax=Brachyhypopomus gauderio TaxID=698409 RepID=UPI004041CB2A
MTMDFSRLHTYTPPQCAPENTGYTYSLSSSYSTAALEFEKEHKIAPVYDSPRMSRRSLRLRTMGGLYGNSSFTENSQNHSVSYSSSSSKRSVRGRKQQSLSSGQSTSGAETAQSSAGLSCHQDTPTWGSVLMSRRLEQSTISHTEHSYAGWNKMSMLSSTPLNGSASVTETHNTVENGYICHNCSVHAGEEEALTGLASASTASVAQTGDVMDGVSSISTVYSVDKHRKHKSAHSSYCGSVNMKGQMTRDDPTDLSSSLCYGLRQVGRGVVSAGAFVVRTLLSVVWLIVLSPGQALTGVFWWLGTAWYQLVTLMSLVNVFILTRCFPKLLRLLLFLLPFLLLLGLWYLGVSTVIYYLPVLNVTEWRAKLPGLPPVATLFSPTTLAPAPSHSAGSSSQTERGPLPVPPQPMAASVDDKRMARLEQSVAALWESVQQREQQASRQHGEAVKMVHTLQEEMITRTDKETLALWVSQLLEPKFDALRGKMEREASDRAQSQEQNTEQQKTHAARLVQIELLLQALTSRTEEVYQRQKDPPAPAPADVGGIREDGDALLAEVQRLETELGYIRKDLQGLMGCQGKCGQFDTLHETVSAQVREDLYTLFYGGDVRSHSDVKLPESLLQWLSSQYTSSSDLHTALTTLERSILGNVSVQLEQSSHRACAQTVSQSVAHTAGAAGMTEEQVQMIVQNALRLYSQDRTGRVDYALESGGGSILSTRCSETYETKTALMSLFGVPLWYFSQSPRVVIQPDVYPGNCWAFKGSQGYLVIRLSLSVLPTSFCLEHIPKALSPTGTISSAPRHFRVYGLEDEYQEEGKLLGDYTYQEDGEGLQTFPVMENNDTAFQIIELRVLSNWGHPEYTCLYRFRVHGDPSFK